MPGENITILEEMSEPGGAFDGAGDTEKGFIARGGREMGQHFECFWDIMKDIEAEAEAAKQADALEEQRKSYDAAHATAEQAAQDLVLLEEKLKDAVTSHRLVAPSLGWRILSPSKGREP